MVEMANFYGAPNAITKLLEFHALIGEKPWVRGSPVTQKEGHNTRDPPKKKDWNWFLAPDLDELSNSENSRLILAIYI